MAGESLTYENQRAIPVRPDNFKQGKPLLPIIEESGGEDAEEKIENLDEQWKEVDTTRLSYARNGSSGCY